MWPTGLRNIAEQIVDIPAPLVGDRIAEQIAVIPVPLCVFALSSTISAHEAGAAFEGVSAFFPSSKKVRGHPRSPLPESSRFDPSSSYSTHSSSCQAKSGSSRCVWRVCTLPTVHTAVNQVHPSPTRTKLHNSMKTTRTTRRTLAAVSRWRA